MTQAVTSDVALANALERIREMMPVPGNFEECFAFSIHKAGSTLMNSMIAEVCRRAGLPAANIPSALFKEGIGDRQWSDDERVFELLTPGRLYFGFRMLPGFLFSRATYLRQRKAVLLIRDPRDALVSQYFSFGGKHLSHRLPEKNQQEFIAQTLKTSGMEIDEYVLQAAPSYLKKLEMYAVALELSAVLVRKYEDIFYDKRKFLGDIFEAFELAVPQHVLDDVADRNDVRPEREQVGNHIRKGVPGDHREKLRPATIAKLNSIFRDIGARYGYDLAN